MWIAFFSLLNVLSLICTLFIDCLLWRSYPLLVQYILFFQNRFDTFFLFLFPVTDTSILCICLTHFPHIPEEKPIITINNFPETIP